MPDSPVFVREVLGRWRTRLVVAVPAAAGGYQFCCDQFDWPTLPKLWHVTGAGMPWWAWLIIAQSGFVYALFEYVRKHVRQNARGEDASADEASWVHIEQRLSVGEESIKSLMETVSRREAIIADAERREERAEAFKEATACSTRLQEGVESLQGIWEKYRADPHRKGHGAVESASGQFYYDCRELIGLPPRSFPQNFSPDLSAKADFRSVSGEMNKMTPGDAKEFEQVYTTYIQYLAAAEKEKLAAQQGMRENSPY